MTVVLESIAWLVVLLGTLVFVHEAGHFVVAKALGIRVETFSLGFGPRLLGFRRGDTDYRVSAVPLGGYVKMTGEMMGDPADAVGDSRAFSSKPRWARFLVMAAGATVNIVVAILIWTVVYTQGVERPVIPDGPPVVEALVEGGPAAQAGLRAGDRILAVDGRSIDSYRELQKEISFQPGATLGFEVERGGERLALEVTVAARGKHRLGEVGFYPRLPFEIRDVEQGGAADLAGLQPGDRVVSFDGEPVESQSGLVERIRANAGHEVELVLERGGATVVTTVVPIRAEDGAGRIGVGLGVSLERVVLPVGQAFVAALGSAWDNADLLFHALRQLAKGAIGFRAMSGPIEIASFSRQAAELGLTAFLQLMAIISLQLGIINLLPIPVLDGGNIMILAVEGVARRDLSLAFKERIMQAGVIFLLLLMVVVIGFDIVKSLPSSGG